MTVLQVHLLSTKLQRLFTAGIIEQLLIVDETHRLGQKGAEEVKAASFFHGFDFELLLSKKV